MPRTATVTTRQLAPMQADDSDRQTLLHQPVRQLADEVPDFKVEYEWFTPEIAQQWLDRADEDTSFRQRPTRQSGVRRWKNLLLTERFVHFLPNTPICVDPDGVFLNGKHRLSGLIECPKDTKAGFMVIYNVPRWMFAFFDTNQTRTLKDVFHIGAKPQKSQTDSAMKLAMRYEEFLLGLRQPSGWRYWASVKDEHQDVDSFFDRRDELQDWYSVGEKIYRYARLLVPSVMVFRFYQSLAWPEGDDQLQEFTQQLVEPGILPRNHPVVQLRNWSIDLYENRHLIVNRLAGKRELQLKLLFRHFELTQSSSRITGMNWAYGMPMSMPYHPKGPDVAVKNIRLALEEIDREFLRAA